MADESDFVDPYDFSFEIRDEGSARLSGNHYCTAYASQSRSDLTTGDGNNVKKSESPAEGYAEFFRLMARHRIQVFSELNFDLEQLAGRGTLGKGGTYIVHCGELLKPLAPDDGSTASGALPLLSKCHDEVFRSHRPIEVDNLKEGTVVVSKHINIEGRPSIPEPGDYLPSLIREALVLSHPTIREKMELPSLFGFGIETLVADYSGRSQQFPIMLLEMGSGGNLEEWFRGMWRAKSSQRKRGLSMGREEVRFTGPIESKLVFSWKRKMHMASQLASALAALHEVGVVHGDVKATNVICCPLHPKDQRPHSENFLQLCDLGSCVILSDIAPGAKSTLLSHSPPWNAPESTSRLDRTGLVKTDVYSFGLLLARILLDGNHPFDEDYHIISGKQSAHDAAWISGLQKDDLVVEHVISQILKQFDIPTIVEDEATPNNFLRVLRRGRDPGFDGCAYTESQRAIIKMLIRATLRSSPHERLGSMRRLTEFLGLAKTDSDEELVKLTNSNLLAVRLRDTDSRFEQDNPFWVFRHLSILRPKDVDKAHRRDFTSDCHLQQRHSFQDRSSTRYADEKNGVPNLLDPIFGYLLNHGLLTINLANDLQSQAANGSAEASLQVAWCYLHGWGSERSRDEFHRYFTQAIMDESLTALENLPMIAALEGQDFLHPSIPNKEEIMRRSTEAVLNAVSRHPDISSAAFLETWEPEKFADKVMSLRISSENTRNMDACICSENITDLQTQQIQHASRVGDFEKLENLIREAKKSCTSPLDLSVPLLESCARGHAFIVLFIIQEGADPCAKDVNGRSPLHFLARFDDDMVRNVGCVLLDDGASLSTTDNSGLTPLAFVLDGEKNFLPSSVHMAAKFLIENGASIDGSDANAPFTKALLTGDVRLVHLLETSLNSKKLSEGTAEGGQYFVGAISAAVTEALKEPEALRLRKRGAWKHHFVHGLDYDLDKHPDLLETISILGRSLNPYVWELAVVKHRALDVARLLDSPLDWPPATGVVPPIFIHGQIGDLEMTRSLLQRGIKFDSTLGIANVNVFHIAAAYRWPVGLLEVLCREQQGAVSLKAMVNQLSTVGRCNPFDLALTRGDLTLAEFFRNLGADTDSPHIIIPTPTWLNPDPHNLLPWAPRKPFTILGAMIYGHRSGSDAHLRAIKYVLGMRPSAVVCPEENMNVFHAVWPRWREVPRTKIQPESSDPYDNTNRLFDLLVRNFNDASLLKVADTWNGATPLHYAAVSGNINGVRRLLDLGAEVNTICVTPEELLMRHLIHETGIKPLIESRRLTAPVAQFTVSDPLLYILVEVYQLLVAERLRKEGNLREGELRGQRNPYMDIIRISCHLAHDPRTVDIWMNRNITQYTLVQFLPPPTRQDLPSFNFEFVPPGWRDRFIKPLPQSCHKFALDFIYATRKFELCKRFHNCFSDRHAPQHIGWSGSGDCFFDCASSDEQPEISELTRFRDELGRRWGDVKRQSPARYDNHSDPNIPYLKILIPEGNVGWITFGVVSHSRKWDGDAVDLQGLAEDSSTCFEIGTIQPDGSVSERHVLGHFADGKSSWANHLMLWKLDTAPQEAREWMTRLTPGTVIGVFPRAKGLGWVNFVKLMTLRFGLEGRPEAGNSGGNSETRGQSSSTI